MGVPGGRTVPQVVQNVDPCPTLLEHMAATPATPVDGRSVGPLLHPAEDPTEWRTVALVEHQGPNRNPDDPDYAVPSLGGLGQDPAQLCLGRPAGSLAARTTPAGLSLDGKVDLRDLGGAETSWVSEPSRPSSETLCPGARPIRPIGSFLTTNARHDRPIVCVGPHEAGR